MKILIPSCFECDEKVSKCGEKLLDNSLPGFTPIELNENGAYLVRCPKGHVNWVFLQEQLFQILFDLGVLALSDSYTREAVSSFATSLERFYEFIIKLILLSDNASENRITKYWKKIAKQSERQIGAYLGLFTYKFKQIPPYPDDKWITFRNDVLHTGKIPSEKMTLDYGQMISDLIIDVLLTLKNFYKENVWEFIYRVYEYNTNEFLKKNPQIKKTGWASYSTIIELRMIYNPNFGKINIASEVIRYKNIPTPLRLSYVK